MRIGIDFDNTIAIYDNIFIDYLKKFNFDNKINTNPKDQLKKNLFKTTNGLNQWNKIQGQVYGKKVQKAKLASGFSNFIKLANHLQFEIFIVSHKTKYGHLDQSKVKLRDKAILWMNKNSFFDLNGFAIKKNNIFFCSTRKEKIFKIKSLKLNFFIDDLNIVLNEIKNSNKTKKIHYSRYEINNVNTHIKKINNWDYISDYIFKISQLDKNRILCNSIIDKPILNFVAFKNNGNSSIYKFNLKNKKKYIAKIFPFNEFDKRNRIENELRAINYLQNKIKISKIYKYSFNHNIIIYNYIDGKKVNSLSLDKFSKVVRKMKRISMNTPYNSFPKASESCFNFLDIKNQFERRINQIYCNNKNNKKLNIFLKNLTSKWKEKQNLYIRNSEIDLNKKLPKKYHILSQSDFGFHNSLDLNNQLIFFDFEYFGWDDPVKLVSDFIWHPRNKLNNNKRIIWLEDMKLIFSDDPNFSERFSKLFIFFGFKWILIILNVFNSNYYNIKKNNYNLNAFELTKNKQFKLANDYLNLIDKYERYRKL